MRKLRLILLGFLALLFLVADPAFANDVSGVFMVVKGDVKLTTKDGKMEAVKVGKKVTAGDSITTGPDSRAKIVMADKNVLNLSPDSKIVIEKYSNSGTEKNVELKVEFGKVRANVEQKYDGEKSKFNIKTPSAVAGVRGTDFITGYTPSTKTSQIVTFSGAVAVGTPGPGGSIANPVYVRAGEMTSASGGAAPAAPKPVPASELKNMNAESNADVAKNSSPAGSESRAPAAASEGNSDSSSAPAVESAAAAAPAAAPSMVDSSDLGPEAASNVQIRTPSAAPVNFAPGAGTGIQAPVQNPLLNNIGNTKSNVIIDIRPTQ